MKVVFQWCIDDIREGPWHKLLWKIPLYIAAYLPFCLLWVAFKGAFED